MAPIAADRRARVASHRVAPGAPQAASDRHEDPQRPVALIVLADDRDLAALFAGLTAADSAGAAELERMRACLAPDRRQSAAFRGARAAGVLARLAELLEAARPLGEIVAEIVGKFTRGG